MKRKAIPLLLALSLGFGIVGCNSRTDKSDGSVVLSVSDFDGLPTQVSANQAVANGGVVIGQVTLSNFPKDPRAVTSDLMSVELNSFEVIFDRADTGTREPPPRVRGIFGLVPINGTTIITNLDVVGLEQLLNPPLSDLLFENGGFDKETGSPLVVINVRIRFFGRTLAGDQVATLEDTFTLELVP
jgi:hypothetical protein